MASLRYPVSYGRSSRSRAHRLAVLIVSLLTPVGGGLFGLGAPTLKKFHGLRVRFSVYL
jgi:hypothetical protein